MAAALLPDLATEAAASIADVGSRIEDVFAKVGGDLGEARAIFEQLNAGSESLAQQLSGSKIESASDAFHDIAARLRGLAQTLPAETALLGTVATCVARASALLQQLIKHIHTIGIITRSSRIEAASLDGDRDEFMSFTREAAELAKSVERSIVACSREQEQLAKAIATALRGQTEFESRYLAQLLSVSAELISAHREIRRHQTQSMRLAESARTGTMRIGGAVGTAIVSLQAGDSARQRFEHICSALEHVPAKWNPVRRQGHASTVESTAFPVDTGSRSEPVSTGNAVDGAGAAGGMAPVTTEGSAALFPFICVLEGAQLRDSVSEFEAHLAEICRSLAALSSDSARMTDHRRALYGGDDGDMTSFLAVMKQRFAQASSLVAACGRANMSVAASMSVSENLLGKFRDAISALDDAVADITLIGMNAGLKAARLGDRGAAFVVIADELKFAAERISAGANLLNPVLDTIEKSAEDLKMLRLKEEALRIADLESSIIHALQDIEAGNGQLGQLMTRLTRESAEFETLVTAASGGVRELGSRVSGLSGVAVRLEALNPSIDVLSTGEARRLGELSDDLYARYTMVRERDIHLKYCDRFKLARKPMPSEPQTSGAGAEDPIFF
jgi:hypothetical protein